MQMTELEGMAVITKDGHKIGEICGADFSTEDWRLGSLAIRLDRGASEELGFEAKILGHSTMEVPTQEVSAASDTVILNTTVDDLRKRISSERLDQATVATQ